MIDGPRIREPYWELSVKVLQIPGLLSEAPLRSTTTLTNNSEIIGFTVIWNGTVISCREGDLYKFANLLGQNENITKIAFFYCSFFSLFLLIMFVLVDGHFWALFQFVKELRRTLNKTIYERTVFKQNSFKWINKTRCDA